MQANPMTAIEPIKYEDSVKQAFSDVDIDKMRAACRTEEERAIMEMLLSSGARVSELCAMDRNDIDMTAKCLVIKKGKGGKQRITYFSDVCREHLVQYLNSRNDSSPWLFGNHRRKRISKLSVERFLKSLGERAGVGNVHPHRFRRTYATALCKKGMDISTLQVLMGHSDINTTRSYVSLSQDFICTQYARYA